MIDISRLSTSELDRFLYLQGLVDRQKEAQETVKTLRDYYYGNHPVLLTARQHEFLGAIVKDASFKFTHNLVRTIIDTLRERLNVIGFTVNGKAAGDLDEENPDPDAQLAALMWSWWNSNRMDSEQIRCHRRTLRDGLTYAIVDFDVETGRPRINLHKMDDGQSGITFHRDPTNTKKVLFANRYFYDYNPLQQGKTGVERKTTYLPGEVRKYIRRAGVDWEMYSAEDNGVWPLPWKDALGQPLGVPVIEFANPAGSEMTQVIGLQNAINKSWLDVIAGADASGFPVMVAEYPPELGLPPENPDENIEGTDENRIGPGRMFEIAGKLHRIEAASLSPMLEVVWALVAALAGVSRTPQYYLKPMGVSDNVSGETLKMLDSGLVKRAEERQLMFGQSWADVCAMMVKVARTFGSEAIPELETMDIAAQWDSAETRNELLMGQTAQMHKAMNVPDDAVWALLGYEPDKIASFQETARAQRAAEIASIAESLRVSQTRTTPQTQPQAFTNGNGTQRVPDNVQP